MLFAAEHSPQRAHAGLRSRPLLRQEPLLGPFQAHRRIIVALRRNHSRLDGPDQRLQRAGLKIDVALSDQHRIAAGGDRVDGGVGHGVVRAHGLHLEVVTQNHTVELQFLTEKSLDDGR